MSVEVMSVWKCRDFFRLATEATRHQQVNCTRYFKFNSRRLHLSLATLGRGVGAVARRATRAGGAS